MPKKNSMNDELESIWVPKPKAWVVVVLVIGILCHWKLAEGNNEHSGRKLEDYVPGFISIDCGETSDYRDEDTGIFYKSDIGFVDTGTNNDISPQYYYSSTNPDYGRLAKNLRSFPQGTRNCYTLRPEQGKNSNYLIRAFFHYGNYDNKNEVPKFDLYVGVNYWTTVEPANLSFTYLPDMIYVPTSDIIHVCLINTGSGIPFISALELRPLDKSLYPIDEGALYNGWRYKMGTSSDDKFFVRYKSDAYDRFWYSVSTLSNWVPINTSSAIDIQGSNDSYKPPSEVLRTAFQPPSGYHALLIDLNTGDNFKGYVCFHLAEIAELKQEKKREFIVSVNGGTYTSKPITLDHFKPLSMCPNQIFQGHFSFSINATTGSDLPPILNAFEIYIVISPFYLFNATDSRDVTAIMEIKQTSKISREDWQGDPCSPNKYSWSGLTCSSDYTPRIISL